MADNYLEKKMEALQARKAAEQRARQVAWKKRMDAYRRKLAEEKASSSHAVHFFNVAGHVFQVCLPVSLDSQSVLKSYQPFVCGHSSDPLFTLSLEFVDDLANVHVGEVKECLNDEPPYFWMFSRDGKYDFGFSYTRSHPDCIVAVSDDFSNAVVHVSSGKPDRYISFAVDNALMLMYAARSIAHDTLLIHASVIRHSDAGYVFLGKSGTGKSTHSRLWLENIEGAELLNDDNPVIRLSDGQVNVYGSPWSGKTHCYKNEVVPLKGIVRLSQAPHNVIKRLAPLNSYASLYPACSCMRWDRNATEALHKTVESVIMKVKCWHLECLPDADAAHVCHNAVKE